MQKATPAKPETKESTEAVNHLSLGLDHLQKHMKEAEGKYQDKDAWERAKAAYTEMRQALANLAKEHI